MANIRKYQAKTITEALAMVRADLGRDAVIVQTRKVNKRVLGVWGREVVEVWASDNPELENLRRPPTRTLSTSPESSSRIEQLENEIQNLKAMIAQLARQGVAVVSESVPSGVPARNRWVSLLTEAEVEEDIAGELIQSLSEDTLSEGALQSLIAERLLTSGPITLQEAQPKVVILVGPTGVGKTTTIAKLAAQYALLQKRRVGLITIDTYRIAAVEQLRTYSQIIDVPIRVVYSSNELPSAVREFSSMDVVFVDTAGRSQRNTMQIGELKACCERLSRLRGASGTQQHHQNTRPVRHRATLLRDASASRHMDEAGREHYLWQYPERGSEASSAHFVRDHRAACARGCRGRRSE